MAVAADSIGIDIGSLYLKVVALDASCARVLERQERHHGNVTSALDRCLSAFNGRRVRVGITSRVHAFTDHSTYDPVLCLAAGGRALCPLAANILDVGGSSLTLVRVDEDGRILSAHRNSLCAAGAGSFLDEQAARLNIDGASSDEGSDAPPAIGTRCAVFARSDLIHRQHEGYPPEALWSGLCRGLAERVIRTLTYGQPLSGRTALCGGVALHKSFVWWLEWSFRQQQRNGRGPILEVAPGPQFSKALGAALLAARADQRVAAEDIPRRTAPGVALTRRRPPLSLVRSHYPSTIPFRRYINLAGTETAVHAAPSAAGRTPVFLGVDVGSTSTKCAVVDVRGGILADAYRRTEGDPIDATRKLLTAVADLDRRFGFGFDVRAAATTGSGRKLIGTVIGADLVVNEISAHGAGAIHLAPSAETVFEIGGQDAKYLSVRDSGIVDANMNHMCAAGTGSFVETVAASLGYGLEDAGTAALGVAPPFTGSRCTVFMEQDVLDLLHRGFSRAEALGAALYSVVENYLDRVVGTRRVSRDQVFFQGATARNRGLVAAIENLLGVEVVVSPHCHVMGAYGAALLAQVQIDGRATRFRGLDLGQRVIAVEEERCRLCSNDCRISRMSIEGLAERPEWGMLCGRNGGERQSRIPAEYRAFQERIRETASPAPAAAVPATRNRPAEAGASLVIPRALTTYSFFQFWQAFFSELGFRAELGPPTTQECLERGKECAGSELCLPVKLAHGHVLQALSRGAREPVFLPYMIADDRLPGVSNAKFCPYVEALPSLVRAALTARGFDRPRLLTPVIDLSADDAVNARGLEQALESLARVSRRDVMRALRSARGARKAHLARVGDLGRDALTRLRESGRTGVVVIGRPYNTLDPVASLDLARLIGACGVDVIPMDYLPFDPAVLTGEFRNMFWHHGQRILSAVAQVARSTNLYAVYLTNFGCGPDSFLLSYAESIMAGKPMLVLELDEQGASGGYQTRVEAFLDVLDRRSGRSDVRETATETGVRLPLTASPAAEADRACEQRTLWLPAMHPVGARLLAAAIRSGGADARVLPPEDDESCALGRRLMRGTECLPAPLTVGSFVAHMERERGAGRDPSREASLFMPTACGPCRFGQYRTLGRLVLDRLGRPDIPIVSPGSSDTYFTLRPIGRVWESVLAGDILFKMRCRVRPYEKTTGDADEMLERHATAIESAVAGGRIAWDAALTSAADGFLRIPVRTSRKPLVGIVGEIYVRSSPYANRCLVDTIERLGGEAWLAPTAEWFEYTAWVEHFLARRAGRTPGDALRRLMKRAWVTRRARRMYRPAMRLLHDRVEPDMKQLLTAGRALLPIEFQGESILTVGRAKLFESDGCALVVNCAPFGCMHGCITTALFEQLHGTFRIPVVSVFYGEGDDEAQLLTLLQQASREVAAGGEDRCVPA